MKCLANIVLALLLSLSIYDALLAAERTYTTQPRTTERKEISNALRRVVEKELKKSVKFHIDALNVRNGWAFMRGVPLKKSGKRMDYKGTNYQESINAGTFDDWICSLLRKESKDARWRVVVYTLGATDVPFADWAERYHAPPDIFK